MEINYSECGDYYLMEIFTHVNLYNVAEFKKVLFELTDGSHANVAVALNENATYMDSSVISSLISAQKKMKALGGQFALINVQEELENIFALAGLKDFFRTFRNVEELKESLV